MWFCVDVDALTLACNLVQTQCCRVQHMISLLHSKLVRWIQHHCCTQQAQCDLTAALFRCNSADFSGIAPIYAAIRSESGPIFGESTSSASFIRLGERRLQSPGREATTDAFDSPHI